MLIERMKTMVLSVLIITSIALTTQLWFGISTKGIFVMPKTNEIVSDNIISEYNKADLIRPNRIVVNLGEKGMHYTLFNNDEGASIYQRVFQETENIVKSYMNKDGVESIKTYSIDKLDTLRNGRNIELIFENNLDAQVASYILDIPEEMVKDIKQIDSVIISPSDNKLYVNDIENEIVVEYKFKDFQTAFPYIISLVEKIKTPYGVFLNEAYPDLYSRKVVIPISMNSYKLPVLTGKKETEQKSDAEHIVSKFFDFGTARSITDRNGTTIYTDGQAKAVRIEKSGAIEYTKYDAEANARSAISKAEAVKISTDFINKHLGFPEGAYIASIQEKFQNGRLIGYDIGFKYSFSKVPIILDSNMENNPIEIEIVGSEVKSYKRFVRVLQNTQDSKTIKNAIDVLNILYKNVAIQTDIKKTIVKNMYLGYYEYQDRDNKLLMIPVWIVEIEQSRQGTTTKSQYIINAETNVILKY